MAATLSAVVATATSDVTKSLLRDVKSDSCTVLPDWPVVVVAAAVPSADTPLAPLVDSLVCADASVIVTATDIDDVVMVTSLLAAPLIDRRVVRSTDAVLLSSLK